MDSNNSAAVLPVLTDTKKAKQPKRILYFSDGILEEYSDDEETEDQMDTTVVDPNSLSWIPYLWYYAMFFGGKTVNACDLVGEYLAYFFGITSPKYQYEIDEYNWIKKQEEEEKRYQSEEEFWKNAEDFEGTIDMQPMTKLDEGERY